MTANDKIFITLLCLSALLVGGVISQRLIPAPQTEAARIPLAEKESAQTERIRKQFEGMGLPLHEGQYGKAE